MPKKGFLFKFIITIVLVLILCVAGLWIWSGTKGSLEIALSFAQGRLPVKSLIVTDSQASLRNGGVIGNIQIEQNDGSSIALQGITVKWNLFDLLSKKLDVEKLFVTTVHFTKAPVTEAPVEEGAAQEQAAQEQAPQEQPNNKPDTLPSPPQEITLPILVHLQEVAIERVIQGEKEEELASNISLSYQYDGSNHHLILHRAKLADGTYEGDLTLTAQNPTLEAALKGVLTTQVPESNQNVSIDAQAKITGPLTSLHVSAQANASTASNTANKLGASLEAKVTPWEQVKVSSADINLQSFNVKAFWAQAPQTLMSGTVKITTSADEKTDVALNLKNAIPGAIDLSKLPVSAVLGTVTLKGNDISFNKLDVKLGSGTAVITGHAKLPQSSSSALVWQANTKLSNVDPRGIYSQVAADRLSGTIALTQKVANTIGFSTDITAANASNIPLFKVKHFVSQGTFFVNNRIVLNSVTASTGDAQVKGTEVTYALHNGAASGNVALTAPGLNGTVALSAFAQKSGSARVVVDIQDAEKASQWLRTQPIKMKPLLDFVDKAAQHTKNITPYVKNIPVVLSNGWENPQVKVDLDLNAIIVQIIQARAKEKLLERIGLPQDSQEEGGDKPRQQVEDAIVNRLGGILGGRSRNK